MPFYQPRHASWIEAWQWKPGLNLDGLEERTVTHSHMSNVPRVLAVITRHGKEYFVPPGDYVYRDSEGNWDAYPRAHFEGQYILEDEVKSVEALAPEMLRLLKNLEIDLARYAKMTEEVWSSGSIAFDSMASDISRVLAKVRRE